jgi:hypothetical protein
MTAAYDPWKSGELLITPGMTMTATGQVKDTEGRPVASASTAAANKVAEETAKKEQEKLNVVGPKNPTLDKKYGVLKYPGDMIDDNTDYVMFQFSKYSPPFKADSNDVSSNANPTASYNSSGQEYSPSGLPTILLYMPEDISTGFKTNWTGKNFSNIGASILKTAGAQTAMDKLSQGVEGVDKAFSNFVPLAGAQIVNAAIGKITGESISLDEFFGGTRGVILNPNSELLFSGLDMRNFSLNYKLVARSAEEATIIENIIKTFKRGILPYGNSDYRDPGAALGQAALGLGVDIGAIFGGPNNSLAANYIKVPDVCRISFMRGGSLNNNVPQYKMCALTQVDVSYTPDGTYATTRDGRMVAYQLSLNFQETKLIFREDVEAGY